MNRINVDGNLHALSQYEQRMDEIDALNEQFEQEANDHAMSEIINSTSDLFDYISDLPKEVYDEIALAVDDQYNCGTVDYCEVGRLFIQHLTDGIVESKYFDDLSDRWIENQQGN